MMAILRTGWLFNALRPAFNHVTSHTIGPALYVQTRDYAARKGTRARKLALKKANLKKKAALKAKKKVVPIQTTKKADLVFKDDSKKEDIPPDTVYVAKFYKWKIYPFNDAIESHRETHDPMIFGAPDAILSAYIELDLQTRKKTKFIEKIDRVLLLPHIFQQAVVKNILFLSELDENLQLAKNAGANVVAGRELLKQIRNGTYSLEEHDYCLAHPDILPQLLLCKGVFKNKLPTAQIGTLSSDVEQLIRKYKNGVHYKLRKSESQKSYGVISAPFGRLNMPTESLEENFTALIRDVMQARRLLDRNFIIRTRIECPPSPERLVVDASKYVSDLVSKPQTKGAEVADDEEEEDRTGIIEAV